MRTNRLAFIATLYLLTVSSPSVAEAPAWSQAGRQGGATMYVDLNNLAFEGRLRKIWWMVSFDTVQISVSTQNRTVEKYSSTSVLSHVDCKARTMSEVEHIFFRDEKASGPILSRYRQFPFLENQIPGTFGDAVIDYACGSSAVAPSQIKPKK